MVVIRHPALGAAPVAIAVSETASMRPRQAVRSAVATILSRPPVMTAAAVTDLCIQPTLTDAKPQAQGASFTVTHS